MSTSMNNNGTALSLRDVCMTYGDGDGTVTALYREKSQEIVKLLADEAHANGVGAVMVTHDRNVLAHCDRVYEMIDGQLHAKSN